MPVHPLDLICINIGCIHLYRGRQIDNNGIFRSSAPFLLNCGTNIQGKIQLRACKTLRRIFENNFSRKCLCIFFYKPGTFQCNSCNFFSVHVEHHIPLQGGCGIVNMHNGLVTALDGLKCPGNLFFAALCQNLNPYIIRNQFPLYQLSQKIILNLTGCRKTDLYLLKSQLNQVLEHLHFFFHDHGINQRLVTVSQIHTTPYGRFFNFLSRPLPFGICYHRILLVTLVI